MHEPIRRLVLSSEYRAYVQACWIWWFTEAVHRRLISLIYGFYWTIQSSSSFDGELIVSRVCFVGWEMDDERQNNIERREADQTHNWNSFSIVVLVLQSIKWNTHAREGRRNISIELRARVCVDDETWSQLQTNHGVRIASEWQRERSSRVCTNAKSSSAYHKMRMLCQQLLSLDN